VSEGAGQEAFSRAKWACDEEILACFGEVKGRQLHLVAVKASADAVVGLFKEGRILGHVRHGGHNR